MPGLVAGVDEVGRGPLAGPVMAAAVILGDARIVGLKDSKRLSPKKRAGLSDIIRAEAMAVGVGLATVTEIDRLNILEATMLAMTRAVAALAVLPAMVLVDGNRCPAWGWPSRAIVKGDATVPEIAAASIVAKVARDRKMADAARNYPGYGWERNAGYGVPEHLAGLRKYGATPLHRRSFAPVRKIILAKETDQAPSAEPQGMGGDNSSAP